MRRMIVAASAVMLATAATAAPPSAADRAVLEKLAADNDAAWNAKNIDVLISQYAPEGSLRLGAGALMSGRQMVRSHFARAFAARQGKLRHVSQIDNIDMVTPDLALADVLVRIERDNADGSVTLLREVRNHSMVVREDGEWRLRAVRAYPLPPKPAA